MRDGEPAELQHINPAGMPTAHGMTHVVSVTGGRTLYLAGQTAFDAEHRIVGVDDHHLQARQAFTNVVTALAAAGATYADVVKATYYVVRLSPEAPAGFVRGMDEVIGGGDAPPPASTFIGVEALAYEEMLVEIDVIAVVP